MDKSIKTYRITYRTECFVQAINEDEAKHLFQQGEGEDEEFVEVVSLEEVHSLTHLPINEP